MTDIWHSILSGTKSGPSTRQARDQLRRQGDILSVARDVLLRHGIPKFSMERVAKEAGYSRSAVYQYFSSKEELVIVLALETAELRRKLWERAQHFDAKPRERLVALGEVTAILYPRHVLPEIVAFANTVRMKTSKRQQRRLEELDKQDYEMTARVVREALENGDLELPPDLEESELAFGLISLTRGLFASVASAVAPAQLGIADPRLPMRSVGRQILDGVGWRPVSSEWDYRRTMRRIYAELYPPVFLASLGLLVDEPAVARDET